MSRRLRHALGAFLAAGLASALGLSVVTAAPAAADGPPPHPWTWDAPGWGWQEDETWYEDAPARSIWYTSPHGTFRVTGGWYGMSQWHRAHGGGRGALGYPTAAVRTERLTDYVDLGYYQHFERGLLYTSVHGAHGTLDSSPLTAVHRALGGGLGRLGYPSSDVVTEAPGYQHQTFRHGVVYRSPHGTFGVWGALGDRHLIHGGGRGLGYPTSHRVQESTTHYYQIFERGVMYCHALNREQDSCRAVTGAFRTQHDARGGGSGPLGYPVQDPWWREGRLVQPFEGGHLEATP